MQAIHDRLDTETRGTLRDIGLRRRGRHFMVASTGSGKSTLAAALLEQYHKRYPNDAIYIVDPKGRFATVYPPKRKDGSLDTRLFPDGFKEVNHGRRDAVSIVGIVAKHPREAPSNDGVSEAVVLQEPDAIDETVDWLYHNATVQRPSMLYLDESFDFMRGSSRSTPGIRKLQQQGREIGVGTVIVNQRPKWVDATFLTEAEIFYVGKLFDIRDRETMTEYCQGAPRKVLDAVENGMPRFQWAFVDRVDWEKSLVVKVSE